MQHDEFIGHVQHRGRLASRGDAERATRAVLTTLGEHLAGGSAENLAAQLPHEIGRHLRELEATGQRFGFKQFVDRVTEREEAPSVDHADAVQHARAVITTLEEAVSAGEMTKVRDQFPAEFQPLFESGSEGALKGS